MIRKLTEQDHEQVWRLLGIAPSINLFIIGDIEAFGYDSDFQEIWGEFNEQGELFAILLRFYQSFIPYANAEFDVAGFVSIVKNYKGPISLSGRSDIVEQFEPYKDLIPGKKQVTYFAECRSGSQLAKPAGKILQATTDDVDRIIELRQTIDEFHIRADARDMLLRAMETNSGRTYFTQENGVMTACASTAAENSISAMIVGVCTRKEFRNQGLASDILQTLIQDVITEGKTLCLFYDNPAAGRIYKRLGFSDIGLWTMYR